MAAASPTPLPFYGNGRLARQPSRLHGVRHGSPSAILGPSQGFSSNAAPLQNISIGDDGDSSDDDIPAPMNLNPLTRALLEADHVDSPKKAHRPSKIKISRQPSGSDTPSHKDEQTPAPSLRIKRVGLSGAPMRRFRRTPESEEDHPPSQDQENVIVSIQKPNAPGVGILQRDDSVMKPMGPPRVLAQKDDMMMKPQHVERPQIHRADADRPIPLAPIDGNRNTPHRPAPPPPPPKMSVLETATAAAGAATTKTKRRRGHYIVNGKQYQQIGKIGRGGSSEVFRVMAENGKLFALKRVKLDDADEAAVRGYKGEIDLLNKLKDVDRVVRLYDYQVDEEKMCLSVLMEIGDNDLAKLIRVREGQSLDLNFIRYYWLEMLLCVSAIHTHDIVHSDLKPANFLCVSGTLKLIDFGIANAIDIDNTVNVHRDSHVGTPNYMSPESLQDANQAARDAGESVGRVMKLGTKSDVWSLGCILYQMVYGRPPFGHITNQITRVMAIINPNHNIDYPSFTNEGARVPASVRSTLRKCLQRDPALRPTVAQLLDSRDPFLHPDADDVLKIPQELLGQIIQRVCDRMRDPTKEPPTDEEIRQYPGSFYEKIRQLMEEP